MKLTNSTQRKVYCDYFVCAILSGKELPNLDDNHIF